VTIPKAVINIPGRKIGAQYELVFPTGTLRPLSLTSFHLTKFHSKALDKTSAAQLMPVKQGGMNHARGAQRVAQDDFVVQNSVVCNTNAIITWVFGYNTYLLGKWP